MAMEGTHDQKLNVAEKGHGSYWLLGILRWVMVLIFISFGLQKFTPQSVATTSAARHRTASLVTIPRINKMREQLKAR
jgi:uncharacterized membrane protein YphA (DoxX/SURF4 family)